MLETTPAAKPIHWREQDSPELKTAMERVNGGLRLSPLDVVIVRDYCRRWINSPYWNEGLQISHERRMVLLALRVEVNGIDTPGDLYLWLVDAEEFGADPL